MEAPSKSVADWLESFEPTLLKLNNARFLDLFDSKSVACLEKMLSSVLLSVRTCHNTHRPINRLPSEVFANIFSYVQEHAEVTFPETMFYQNSRSTPFPRLDIMSVCRHWRDMMLAYRALWSTIIIPHFWENADHAKYIKYCLKQSGCMPLNVYGNALDVHCLDPIAAQSSRLRVLHLRFTERYATEHRLFMFRDPAPALECLHIHNDAPDPAGADLPLLFSAQTPSLRYLKLHGISSWGANNFTTLTHLTIHDGRMSSSPDRKATKRLLALLQANPGLEEINLSNMSIWHSSRPIPEDLGLPHIDLRQLQRLHLKMCPTSQAEQLLAHLKLTFKASMHIYVEPLSHPEDDTLFSFLPNDISNLHNLSQITTLTIHEILKDSTFIVIGCGPSSGIRFEHLVGDATDYEDDDEEEQRRLAGFYRASISHLCEFPFVGQLKELWLTREGPETSDLNGGLEQTYRNLFQDTVSLTTLYLSGGRALNVLKALLPSGRQGVPTTISRRLQVLIISEGPNLPREVLLVCVKRRAEAGYPIRQLSIYLTPDGGPGDIKFLNVLRRYVDVVDPKPKGPSSMAIPESWGARRHDYWPEWNLEVS